jgi:hypothetical protein
VVVGGCRGTAEYFIPKAIYVFQKELNSEIVVKDNR